MKKAFVLLFFTAFNLCISADLEQLKGYTLVNIFTLEDIIVSSSSPGTRYFVLSQNYQTQMTIKITDFQLDPLFLPHSTKVFVFGAKGRYYKLVIENNIYTTEIQADGLPDIVAAPIRVYWKSKNGIIHNSTCRFYRKKPGAFVHRGAKGQDCNRCKGRRR